MTLHLSKVAVGCPDIETLARLQLDRWGDAPCSLTRFMPKRAEELIGGSLFWIIAHRLVARQPIVSLDMVTTEWGTKCRIGLAGPPIAVVALPKRAHQGWRYLEAADAPGDLAAGDADALPIGLVRDLQAMWLI
jgi:hypothetical protein